MQQMLVLFRFSGRSHTVYTGVVIVTPKEGNDLFIVCLSVTKAISIHCKKKRCTISAQLTLSGSGFNVVDFHEATDVSFASISPEVIRGYIKTGEPM